jgi:filamentous hemagglutinin family protein
LRSGLVLALLALAGSARGEVVTDIATDGSLGPVVSFVGDPNLDQTFVVDEGLGARPGGGGNLFHSFDRLDLGTGDTLLFTAALPTENVFNRVTGGEGSLIDGRFASSIPGANVFVFNPWGVAFLENARLDVMGSFSASSADAAVFADGVAWPTGEAVSGFLTVQPFAAYGFAGGGAAPVEVDQAADPAPGQLRAPLSVPAGETLSFVGGDVRIVGRGLDAGQFDSVLIEDAGTLQIASVQGEAEVPADVAAFDVDALPASELGGIELTNSTVFNLQGANGGRVVIRGGDLILAADPEAGLVGQNRLTLGTLENDAPAKALDVQVAGEMNVLDGSVIESSTLLDGAGGDIAVRAGAVRIAGAGTRVVTQTLFGAGAGGDLALEAEKIEVEDGAELSTLTLFGDGAAGDVELGSEERPARVVRIAGAGASVAANGGFLGGAGGSIRIQADRLELEGGGKATVSAQGAAPAGDIVFRGKQLVIDGTDPIGQPSSLLAQSVSGATGDAGRIDLQATKSVEITNGGQLSVASRSIGSGRTGDVIVDTGKLVVRDSPEAIKATSFDQDAGNVQITAKHSVRVEDGSITTFSSDASGGNVDIQAGHLILLRRNQAPGAEPLVTAEVAPGQPERGGTVTLAANNVAVDRGGVRASAPGGVGGSIEIQAKSFFATGGELEEVSPGFFASAGSTVFEVDAGSGLFASDEAYFDVTGGFETGEFVVRSPDTALVPEVAALSSDFLERAGLVVSECATREMPVGSLVLRGRDRSPPLPGERLPLPYGGGR